MKNGPPFLYALFVARIRRDRISAPHTSLFRHKDLSSFRFIRILKEMKMQPAPPALHLVKAAFSILTTAIISLTLASCSSSSFVSMKSLKSQFGLKVFPGGKEYHDADAVILSSQHDVDVYETNDGNIVTDVEVTKIIKLL